VNTRRLLTLLLMLAVPALLAAGYFRAAPRVLEVRPTPNKGPIPAYTRLQLTFSRTMAPESVTANFQIDPPVSGQFAWEGTTLTFTPDQPWPGGETVTLQLAAGARAELLGLPLLGERSWKFTIQNPQLIYLWPNDGPAELYTLDPETGDIQQLTRTAHGILDYSASADGTYLFYSAMTATGGSDLFIFDRLSGTQNRLVDCSPDSCESPRSSPDGALLTYQRLILSPGQPERAEIQLRSLGASSPNTATLARLGEPSRVLAWSPDRALLYYDPGLQAFILYDLTGGSAQRFPNLAGTPGDWAPQGEAYMAPEIDDTLAEDAAPLAQPSHIQRLDVETGEVIDLLAGGDTENADPVFSPDGNTVAFARRYLDARRWTPGRQLWLMAPDGSGVRPLTDEPLFTHTDFTWRPDGLLLAYTRFNQVTLTDPPEIWTIDPGGGPPLRLVIGGYDPQWIP
jgi:dipeptidyl aminopeptidase/acylaminoacyl peptidase